MHRVAELQGQGHAGASARPPLSTSPYQAHLAGLELGTRGTHGLGVASLGREGPAVHTRLARGEVAS